MEISYLKLSFMIAAFLLVNLSQRVNQEYSSSVILNRVFWTELNWVTSFWNSLKTRNFTCSSSPSPKLVPY